MREKGPGLMKNDFVTAITELCDEKGISKDIIIEAVEAALVTAYKRNFGTSQNITARLDPASGDPKVYAQKLVVEEVADPRMEISLTDAARISPDAQLDDTVELEMTPRDFGRIAAQTAKQVVMQRLREAERDVIFNEFTDKEGEIMDAVVQRTEPKGIILTIGRVEATMPPSDQVLSESYKPNQHLRVYVTEVHRGNKGPQVVVSRTHRGLMRRLFEQEIPEIHDGLVEIKAVAREHGSRSKVAVVSHQEGLDPVGTCVGQRGSRIQTIVNELNGEKIDVVPWNTDPVLFVANALSPAQIEKVEIDQEDKTATVVVADRQLSLAIGKDGQNARLAAKITGWRIDIKSASQAAREPLIKRKKPIRSIGAEDEETLLKIRFAEALREKQVEESELAARSLAAFQGSAAPTEPPTAKPVETPVAEAAEEPKKASRKRKVVETAEPEAVAEPAESPAATPAEAPAAEPAAPPKKSGRKKTVAAAEPEAGTEPASVPADVPA
jgi:transcription termination/antitermination protein NusA